MAVDSEAELHWFAGIHQLLHIGDFSPWQRALDDPRASILRDNQLAILGGSFPGCLGLPGEEMDARVVGNIQPPDLGSTAVLVGDFIQGELATTTGSSASGIALKAICTLSKFGALPEGRTALSR
jgi:hypothetical protein